MTTFYKIKETFQHNQSLDEIVSKLNHIVPTVMYSCIMRTANNVRKVICTVSIDDKYNTINKVDAIQIFVKGVTTGATVFLQPSLELMLDMYTPYVQSLAYKQYQHWQKYLEYEDLVQLCYLSMIKLYKHGYYLNDKLLYTTYIRDVLLSIRKRRTDYSVVSIEDKYGVDDSLSIADALEDTDYSNKMYDYESLQETLYIFNEVKDMIIDMIGERRFEQLFREYKDKTTTNSNRQMLTRIKREFNAQNITLDSFKK